MKRFSHPLIAALAGMLVVAVITGASIAGGANGVDPTPTANERSPLVIGHRGASGYRPEHTLASYELAARMGADYIEPDLVSTKDGVLVARHENEISGTTDVASHPEFADRQRNKTIDGVSITGWFTEDFTLAELQTLRAKERLPAVRQENTIYDGRFEIPTFQEVIDLAGRLAHELGRPIGIYPETKHPSYFRTIGLPLEPPLIEALQRNGLDRPTSHVFVQSFEVGNLKALNEELHVPLVQLYSGKTTKPYDFVVSGDTRTYGDMATPAGLSEVASYADGVGPSKDYIVPRDPTTGASLTPTSFVSDAHAAGLVVHPYTFRNENAFLPAEPRFGSDPNAYGNAIAEDQQFFNLGVDGIFTDNPDTAVEARG
jgi:glycerophosphoryl diester phosphodiesterase